MDDTLRTQPRRVLVIEPSEFIRSMVLMLLELDGHAGHGVQTVSEARGVLRRQAFDVVVSDVDVNSAAEVVALSLDLRRLAWRPQVVWVGELSPLAVDPEGAVFRDVLRLSRPFDVRSFRELMSRCHGASSQQDAALAG